MKTRVGWRVLVGLAGLLVFGPGMFHLARLSLMQRKLDRRLADLTSQQERLTQEQARLQSDPIYLEGLIRSTFKVAKPGEIVIPVDQPAPRSR